MAAHKQSRTKRPSCEDYTRMPFNEEVIEHLRSCDSCRAVFNQLVDETERLKYEFEHRN
jgi:predicted anti-sigma-YlaC factor YlaD